MSAASRRVVLLSGGVGGSKLAEGLMQVLEPRALTIVANTGDDIELYGLHISPDLDILTYTLSGRVNRDTGWGLAGETWRALEQVGALGGTAWFRLGDGDLGVHLYRTEGLRAGVGLARITGEIARGFGLECAVLPMCEEPVPTHIDTNDGGMHVQEYLVRRRCEPVVKGVRSVGIERARPAPGVLEAIAACDVVLFAPSNPLISLGPILAVPGMKEALRGARAPKIVVSPIVGGKSLKGPLAKMLAELGHEVNAAAVARLYQGIADSYVVDSVDAKWVPAIEALGMAAHVLPAVMDSLDAKRHLARELLALAG